jgi:hypothetical protein
MKFPAGYPVNRWEYEVRKDVTSSQYEKQASGCKTCEWWEEVNTGSPWQGNWSNSHGKRKREDKEEESSSMPYQEPSSKFLRTSLSWNVGRGVGL